MCLGRGRAGLSEAGVLAGVLQGGSWGDRPGPPDRAQTKAPRWTVDQSSCLLTGNFSYCPVFLLGPPGSEEKTYSEVWSTGFPAEGCWRECNASQISASGWLHRSLADDLQPRHLECKRVMINTTATSSRGWPTLFQPSSVQGNGITYVNVFLSPS